MTPQDLSSLYAAFSGHYWSSCLRKKQKSIEGLLRNILLFLRIFGEEVRAKQLNSL